MTNFEELLQSLADNKKSGATRYAFLLGAGASRNSGIQLAGKLAKTWLKTIKKNNPAKYKELTAKLKKNGSQYAALYPDIYAARFPEPQDGYQEIEALMSKSSVWPSIGYSILAQTLNQSAHNLVLTTNFDRLTESALLYYENAHARVIGHKAMLSSFSTSNQCPAIVKLHHDMLMSPISDPADTKKLAQQWNPLLDKVLRNYKLVVLGYGGNDAGLMKMLKDVLSEHAKDKYIGKIYWCHVGDWEYSAAKVKKLKDDYPDYITPIAIPGFDEFMFFLRPKMDYPLLRDSGKGTNLIAEQANERAKSYKRQLDELQEWVKLEKLAKQKEIGKTSSTVDKGDLNKSLAIKSLFAGSWREVQVVVDLTSDVDKKDALYQAGIKKFPNSYELICNYAIFLTDLGKDYVNAENDYNKAKKYYDEAEKYFKEALKLAPDDAPNNGNYAIFLKAIRKDYKGAKKHYDKALKLDPDSANINGNYALFLSDIRKYKDYEKAEKYYKKALEIAPNAARNNSNYAGFLMAQGREEDARPYLAKAKKAIHKRPEELKALALEIAFYQLASSTDAAAREELLAEIKDLLQKGVCSIGRDLSDHIAKARKAGADRDFIDTLIEIAHRISHRAEQPVAVGLGRENAL